jgi:hypothetical protein
LAPSPGRIVASQNDLASSTRVWLVVSADQAIGDWTIVRFASSQQDGDQSMIAERGVLLIE